MMILFVIHCIETCDIFHCLTEIQGKVLVMYKHLRDVNWSLVRPLAILGFVGIFLLFSLQTALSKITDPGISPGCMAKTETGESDSRETVAVFEDRTLTPLHSLAQNLTIKDQQVLGASTGYKWIEIDLANQRLTAHEGDRIFLESAISSGLWNKTPVGEYTIWYKILSTKMEGGSRLNHTYYYLPNVPYSMFFSGDYGIHGTYWHSDFGRPRSHGCVNAPTNVAEKLFYWTDPQLPEGKKAIRASPDNPGTKVVIHQ